MRNEGKYIAVDSYNNRFIVNNTHYKVFMRGHGVQSVVYFDRATGEQILKAETLPDGRVRRSRTVGKLRRSRVVIKEDTFYKLENGEFMEA